MSGAEWIEEVLSWSPRRISQLEEDLFGELHDIPLEELKQHGTLICSCSPSKEIAADGQVVWVHHQAEEQ